MKESRRGKNKGEGRIIAYESEGNTDTNGVEATDDRDGGRDREN